ncbi:MAG: biotin--[acetyl-CoA-carboxylase] ligase [Candidatus Sericytochromatia bacterium]
MSTLQWQVTSQTALDSTQSWIRERVTELSHGFCLTAERQHAGTGREQRSWESASGGLYLSFLLKPPVLLPQLPWALWWALITSLEAQAGVSLTLKAPNDILLQGRKLAGLLVDARLCAGQPEYYICGIGVNVNQTHFSPELAEQAISLRQFSGCQQSLAAVQQAFLDEFAAIYPLLLSQHLEGPLFQALGGRSVQIGYNRPHSFLPFEEYWCERNGLGRFIDTPPE